MRFTHDQQSKSKCLPILSFTILCLFSDLTLSGSFCKVWCFWFAHPAHIGSGVYLHAPCCEIVPLWTEVLEKLWNINLPNNIVISRLRPCGLLKTGRPLGWGKTWCRQAGGLTQVTQHGWAYISDYDFTNVCLLFSFPESCVWQPMDQHTRTPTTWCDSGQALFWEMKAVVWDTPPSLEASA